MDAAPEAQAVTDAGYKPARRGRVPSWPGSGGEPATEFRAMTLQEKRTWLWVAVNGKCSKCGGFLSAANLTPVKSADGTRWGAWCPPCNKLSRRTV